MKYSIEIVKEGKPSFFFTLRRMFYLPFSLFIFMSLLLHNFIIFPPQRFIPSLAQSKYNA